MVNERGERRVNDTELREIYAGLMTRAGTGRTGCPAPEAIRALVVREGDEATRLDTLDHVMSCRECRAELDLLRSIEEAGAALSQSGKSSPRRWLMPAALAASVLFAVLVGRVALTNRPTEVLRSGPTSAAVVLLAPGTEIAAGGPVSFAWRPVAGASRYRIEVLTSTGDMVVEAETPDTTARLKSVGRLAAGSYQWWVIAMTPRPGPRSGLRPLRLIAK
jgi:hypothetical protein